LRARQISAATQSPWRITVGSLIRHLPAVAALRNQAPAASITSLCFGAVWSILKVQR
jgi:hypothetical protein